MEHNPTKFQENPLVDPLNIRDSGLHQVICKAHSNKLANEMPNKLD